MGARLHLSMVQVGACSLKIVGGGWVFATVGQLDPLVGAHHHGSMAVVEGRIVGAGDLTCSQRVSCWAYMGAGGRTLP